MGETFGKSPENLLDAVTKRCSYSINNSPTSMSMIDEVELLHCLLIITPPVYFFGVTDDPGWGRGEMAEDAKCMN